MAAKKKEMHRKNTTKKKNTKNIKKRCIRKKCTTKKPHEESKLGQGNQEGLRKG